MVSGELSNALGSRRWVLGLGDARREAHGRQAPTHAGLADHDHIGGWKFGDGYKLGV